MSHLSYADAARILELADQARATARAVRTAEARLFPADIDKAVRVDHEAHQALLTFVYSLTGQCTDATAGGWQIEGEARPVPPPPDGPGSVAGWTATTQGGEVR